ncbi:hypothetical protein NOVO_00065 [Rickettsiales bacterium Ac37b]|nr:hypothetical protein NOVO_00065 [Rickettsiales bacterium Ac37b]
MIRLTLAFTIFILSGSVLGLFYIKYQVQNLNKDLNELNKQYTQEQESVRVLKAEWSYLNQPERLKELSKKYLNLDKMKLAQVRRFSKDASFDMAQNNKNYNNTKYVNNYRNSIVKTVKHNKFATNQKASVAKLRY